jgi:hypothetical protein
MTSEEFDIQVEKSFLRSKNTLLRKGKEYTVDLDRLDQFHRAGVLENVPSTQALMGFAVKHVTSIVDMAKNPRAYTLKQWHEKTGDLRNYTILLEALLVDLGIS